MPSASNSDESSDLGYRPSPSSIYLNDQCGSDLTPAQSPVSSCLFSYCRTNSETSAFSVDDNSYISSEPSPSRWPSSKLDTLNSELQNRQGIKQYESVVEEKIDDQESVDSEIEMVKERFAKLLLGEDMSGSGKGVCTAVTISNAITNLYATVFGQNLRLEPLKVEKKAMWKREMNCLLSVCDYIVEFFPESQVFGDGITVEVMTSRPRSDIYINLPALQKLDAMLLDILNSFQDTEFWYAEKGSVSSISTRSGSGTASFRRISLRKEGKWWLPVPCIPPGGLSDKARKQLRNKRDCSNQIHKAAKAINSIILADMEIPDSYLTTLPKSGRTSLGDLIYRVMNYSEKFVPENLLDVLNVESEHEALEFADRVEASMYTWRRKACLSFSRSSWDSVKDLVADTDRSDKKTVLAERAESLLFSLKQRFPQLSQTTLDTCKIQYNKDVGKAILESYSRVLEGLAFNIVAWIEDVIFADQSTRNDRWKLKR